MQFTFIEIVKKIRRKEEEEEEDRISYGTLSSHVQNPKNAPQSKIFGALILTFPKSRKCLFSSGIGICAHIGNHNKIRHYMYESYVLGSLVHGGA